MYVRADERCFHFGVDEVEGKGSGEGEIELGRRKNEPRR